MSGFIGVLAALGGALTGTVTVVSNVPSSGDVGYSDGTGGGSSGGSISASAFNGNTLAQLYVTGSGGVLRLYNAATLPPVTAFSTLKCNGVSVSASSAAYTSSGTIATFTWSGAGGQFFTSAGTYAFTIT